MQRKKERKKERKKIAIEKRWLKSENFTRKQKGKYTE